MARTVRDALLAALDDLGDQSFKRFCNKIMDWEIKPGFNKIPRSKMEKAERDDVVDLILRSYLDSYGPELTVAVLNAINERQTASNLQEDLDKVNGINDSKKPKEEARPTSEASSSSAPKPQVEPFVDKHREELVKRCPLVSPILDGLISKKLLSSEEYDTIRAEKPAQNQMRKLYEFMRGWSDSDKFKLYLILKETNPRLIENLEEP